MLEAGWARINSLLGQGKETLVDRQGNPSAISHLMIF